MRPTYTRAGPRKLTYISLSPLLFPLGRALSHAHARIPTCRCSGCLAFPVETPRTPVHAAFCALPALSRIPPDMAGRAGKSYLPRDASRTPFLFNLGLEEACIWGDVEPRDRLPGFSQSSSPLRSFNSRFTQQANLPMYFDESLFFFFLGFFVSLTRGRSKSARRGNGEDGGIGGLTGIRIRIRKLEKRLRVNVWDLSATLQVETDRL